MNTVEFVSVTITLKNIPKPIDGIQPDYNKQQAIND